MYFSSGLIFIFFLLIQSVLRHGDSYVSTLSQLSAEKEPTVEFKQTGYQLRVKCAHGGVTMHYDAGKATAASKLLQRGSNSICVLAAGTFLRHQLGR